MNKFKVGDLVNTINTAPISARGIKGKISAFKTINFASGKQVRAIVNGQEIPVEWLKPLQYDFGYKKWM